MSPYPVVFIMFMNHLYCIFCGEINKYSSSVRFSYQFNDNLKGLAQAKIIKKSVILFRVLNMTI